MAFAMPKLKRLKSGAFSARKVIPKDVRDEYCARFRGGWEERFYVEAGTSVGASCVGIANGGSEKLEETQLGPLAGGSNDNRGSVTCERDKLVHDHIRLASKSSFAALSSRTSLSFQPSAASIAV
ncbi:MAG: hypothetical protein ACJ8F0_17155 [Xanthobacteraceae bacterium]|jgi:hypothetical protein